MRTANFEASVPIRPIESNDNHDDDDGDDVAMQFDPRDYDGYFGFDDIDYIFTHMLNQFRLNAENIIDSINDNEMPNFKKNNTRFWNELHKPNMQYISCIRNISRLCRS